MTDTVHPADPVAAPAAAGRRPRLSRAGDLVLVVAIALALFLPGLASLPLTDRDEARLVEAARQMVETGDYVDIRFQDAPRYQKPVLAYWLQSAAALASGEGGAAPVWVHRLPSLAAAILAVVLTWRIGLLLGGRTVGLAAALMAAATIALGVEARLAKADAILLAAVLAAQWALASLWTEPVPLRRLARNAVFWTALGLGLLAKGPAILLPVLPTLALLVAADRSAVRLRALDPLKGLAWTTLLVAPWLAAIGILSEGRFFGDALGQDFLGKLVGAHESHGAPPGAHIIVAFLTFWPLTALMPLLFTLQIRSGLPAPTRRSLLFLAAWVLPGWIVAELMPTKLPNYVLPFMPAVAIAVTIAAVAADEAVRGRWFVRAGHALVAAGAALLAFGLNAAFVLVEGHASGGGIVLGIAAVLSGFAASWFLMNGRFAAGVAGTVLASGLITALAFAVLLPAASGVWLSDRIADAVASVRPCAVPTVVVAGYREPSLVVLLGRDIRFVSVEDAAAAWLAADCAVAVLPAEDDAAFRAATGAGEAQAAAEGRNLNGFERRRMLVHAKAPAGG